MIKFIPHCENGREDLVAQAMIHKPPEFFERKYGVTFHEGCDQLNYYRGALFESGDGTLFGLIQYKGDPKSTTTLSLSIDPRDTPNERQVTETVLRIVHELGLDQSALLWNFQTKVVPE